jgi:excisionase family DNA binding protein
MEISIKSAAEMVKVSRNTIYEAIKSGKLSRCASGKLESSELIRVFGHPNERHTRTEEKAHIEQLRKEQPHKTDTTTAEQLYLTQIDTLKTSLQEAREHLKHAQERERTYLEREAWQRGQVEKLTDTLKLLEAPKTTTKPSRVWWKFWK